MIELSSRWPYYSSGPTSELFDCFFFVTYWLRASIRMHILKVYACGLENNLLNDFGDKNMILVTNETTTRHKNRTN